MTAAELAGLRLSLDEIAEIKKWQMSEAVALGIMKAFNSK